MELALRRLRADRQKQIGPCESRRDRLPQRPRREAAAIAEAERRIGNEDRKILGKRGVLETVIEDKRLCPGGFGGAGTRGAVPRYPGRAEGREQERLVADLLRRMPAFLDPQRPRLLPAEAARDDMRDDIARGQHLHQRDNGWGLAGAAGGEVADADHRHAGPVVRGMRHAARSSHGGDPRQR